jgi:hypothetical protein
MLVLTTVGVQSEAQLPLAGLHQMLRPVRGWATELPPVQRAALDAAFGLTEGEVPEHFRIAMAVLDLVAEAATAAPVLLVVDDAQWLDRPTADVLAFVARRIASDPVSVVAAILDGCPSALGDSGLEELRLVGLDDVAAEALLDRSVPHLSVASRRRVLCEAAGNPLALLELPAVIADRETEGGVPGVVPLSDRLEWPGQSATGTAPKPYAAHRPGRHANATYLSPGEPCSTGDTRAGRTPASRASAEEDAPGGAFPPYELQCLMVRCALWGFTRWCGVGLVCAWLVGPYGRAPARPCRRSACGG